MYGYDKATFDERVEFVHQRLEEIYDSADNPLTGRRWWTKADDPWQCLATCKELKAALESLDPEAYECALPVHQDGTCNGLQHYAALGGDAAGARQVNLDVADRPSDVYTFVANMVEDLLKVDVAAGNKFAQMLSGRVARKVVKQTVGSSFIIPFCDGTNVHNGDAVSFDIGHDYGVRCDVHWCKGAD